MSESKPNSSTPNGPKKEISTEQRLLLAFGLMGVVLLVSQYLMPTSPEEQKKQTAKQEQTTPNPKQPAASEAEAPAENPNGAPATVAVPANAIGAETEQTTVIETDLAKVVFSNRGGLVRSWVLKKHLDSDGKPLELVHEHAIEKFGYPFAVQFKDKSSADPINKALFAAKMSDDKLGVTFEYSNGGWYAKKSFQLRKNSYLADIDSEVTRSGRPLPHLLEWRGGFGDNTVIGAAASQHSVHYDLDQSKLISHSASNASDGPLTDVGNFSFAGIEDSYFAAVALPDSTKGLELRTFDDMVLNPADKKEQGNVGIALGNGAVNHFAMFVGPKNTALLQQVSPRLDTLVDWGYLAFIAKPLFLGLHFLHDRFIPNWGWSIVAITILINFMLLPLKISSLKSMKKMQLLQPQITAINDKYKGISMRDPKKAEQNQEVMELYKTNGVNPLGGCIPMFLQIPFFIAFYKVLRVAIELRGADFLWVSDLSRPETLAIRILPIAMIVTQFFMQRMTPSTTGDPSQQKVMMIMPLVLGFMFYGLSSGLVLYYLTSNLVGIAQQVFINRTFPTPAVVVPKATAKKSSRK